MNTSKLTICAAALLTAAVASCSHEKSEKVSDDSLVAWYRQPASIWEEALPIGNGSLGAMIFGGVDQEVVQLNEETLWSGRPANLNANPESPEWLPKVREALFAGEWDKARDLCKNMQGLYTESYLPMADLFINYNYESEDSATAYVRALDIANALSTVVYTVGDVNYTREAFASAPDGVIVLKLAASKDGALSFETSMASQLHNQIVTDGNAIVMTGIAPVHAEPSYVDHPDPIIYERDGQKGMRFATKVVIDAKGGKVEATDSTLRVVDANEAVIRIAAATSFNGMHNDPYTEGKDEIAAVNAAIDKTNGKKYAEMANDHMKDYHQYFNRVSLKLNDADVPADKDMLERLKDYREGGSDPALEALYFQLGRYLLISSSRPGGVPANLQGIWNHHLRAPWSSNYTTNINAQMNYWPAEVANLSEMHMPFIEQMIATSDNGREVAKNFYNLNGWALSHNSDIWGQANAVGNCGDGDPMWANWYMGSPWVSQHLYEHYRFTGDEEYLKERAYPVMKEAAVFCLEWLVDDGKGHLVTAPSTSPENSFIGEDGKPHYVTIASTMDMSIIYDLFTNVIEASEILDTDADFRAQVAEAREKLVPLQIGKKGNLQEWLYDYEDQDQWHRHVSHLFGLHPGHQITPFGTPEYMDAAKRTLELRGDGGTGWSLAWKINFWARLLDGDHAYLLLRNLLHVVLQGEKKGGSYPNLFCAHPPFQIDGNFGGTAGIAEMLIQSQNGEIHLLPALPSAWESGEVKGLVARGNVVVDMDWSDSELTSATLHANKDGKVRVRTKQPMHVDGVNSRCIEDATPYGSMWLLEFDAQQGNDYQLKRAE